MTSSTGHQPQASSETQLRSGSIGVSGIVFFVVGAAAPLLVMAGIAPLAINIMGIGAPGGYLIAGASLLVFAVAFTAMSPYIHNAGAFYSYISRGFGQQWGLAAAVLALLSYNALEIGILGAFGFFAQGTVDSTLGIDVPWYVWSLLAILIVWFFGSRSAHAGARVLALLLTAETAILVLLAAAVLVKGGGDGITLSPWAPEHVFAPGLGGVLSLAFAAFIGFEATAIYREEAKDPDRTVPRATYIAVAFLGGFYAFIVWVIVVAFGPAEAVKQAAKDPAGMVFGAMETYVGSWAVTTMEILIVTSILASLLAFHNSITRYCFALAREHVLPEKLARLHPKHASPYVASLAQSVLAAVVVILFAVAGADPYLQLLLWVNTPGIIGIVVLQGMAAGAVLAFFAKDRRGHSVWRVVVAPTAAVLLLIFATYLIVSQVELVTAAGTAVNAVVIAFTPICLAVGFILGARLRKNHPDLYAKVGTTDVDAAELS